MPMPRRLASPAFCARLALCAMLALQGCVTAVAPTPPVAPPVAPDPALVLPDANTRAAGRAAAQTFIAVAERVEPVAEAICRRQSGPRNCNITIAVDDRPGLSPNAYQTVDSRGRPFVIFTLSLIAMAANADELAFVMGHESAHHIAGHIPRRQDQARSGAILAGALAQLAGASAEDVRRAQEMGAEMAARQYSQEFELEADALGAEIAFLAGFDPVRGAAFFDRLPDPGKKFLGTHPPNSDRKALVARTTRRLQGG